MSLELQREGAMEELSIAENFQRYFTIVLATTDELKEEAYRLRYRVYCEEFGFEDAKQYPDGLETDEFDEYAYHGLVVHKETKKIASCLRLVPASDMRQLPFERHCHNSYDPDLLTEMCLSRASMCEVSRLVVDKEFRRRKGEKDSPLGQTEVIDVSMQGRRHLQLLAVSSLFGAIALTELTKRRNIFAMMEPVLHKLLNKAGMPLFKAGKDINYHGMRALYYTRTENTLVNMTPEFRELYEVIYSSLIPNFIGAHSNDASHAFKADRI